MSRVGRAFSKKLLVAITGTLVSLVFLEGLASLALSMQARDDTKLIAERRHTEFDPELGWIHRASCRVPNLYGRGKGLTTNAQRVRAREDLSHEVLSGHHRIVCVGDSFTLGYGVDDADTWPARLAALLPDSETVNMGQGGYGVDQDWLWYRRDATFEHDVVVFAPIDTDFERMVPREAFGFPKPWLALRDGKPFATNTPLQPPRPPSATLRKLLTSLQQTAIVRGMEAATHLFPASHGTSSKPSDDLVAAVLTDWESVCAQRHARFVIALLPTPYDDADGATERWERFLELWAREHGVLFIDLIATLRTVPRETAAALYIDASTPLAKVYAGAAGHYNEAGNQWVADQLAAVLFR